jgi:type VI secretion system secreted protein Hcp
MKRYTFLLLMATATLAATLPTMSFSRPTAFHFYASFKGKSQGQLKGETEGKGGREREGWFELQSFDMSVESPVDASKGAASGSRQHKPVVFTKETDAASPLLWTALTNKEVFESVVVETVDDNKKVTRTVTLTNAIISEIKKNGGLESITFNFEKSELK